MKNFNLIKNNNFKNISVLHKYAFSFVLVFLIPCVCFGFMFFQIIVNEVKTQIDSLYEEKVSNLTTYIENQEKNMLTTSFNIANNSTLINLISNKNIYNEMCLIEFLQLAINQNFFVSECIYYEKGSTDLYSSKGKSELTYFNNDYEYHQKDFFAELSYTKPSINCFNKKLPKQKTEPTLIFTYPLSSNKVMANNAVIIFVVTQENIIKTIQSVTGSLNGSFYILDGKNQKYIPFYLTKQIDEEIINKSLLSEKFKKKETFNGVDYRFISKRTNNKTYLFINTYDEYYKSAIMLNNKVAVLLIVIFLICALISLVLAYFNYKPIKDLIMKFKDPNFENNYGGNDELKKINIIMDNTIKTNRDMKMEILEKNHIIKQDILNSLITGTSTHFSEIEETLDINFKYNSFFIIVCSYTFNANYTNEEKYILRNDLKKCIENIEENDYNIFAIKLENIKHMAILVNTDSPQQIVAEQLFAELIKVENALNTHLSFGIGNTYNDISKLKFSYMEAMSAIETTIDSGDITFFEDLDDVSGIVNYPTKEMMRYLQALKLGKKDLSLQLLKETFETVEKDCTSNFYKIYIISDIVNTIIKFTTTINLSINFSEMHLILEKDFNKLYSKLYELTENICESITIRETTKKTQEEENIILYVENNFCDYDISLEKISQTFDISGYCISKIFKDKTGMGFKDYIIKLRIDKCKNLLKNSNLKINEISENLGYANPSHFIKIFKKQEGVTPEQYRKME